MTDELPRACMCMIASEPGSLSSARVAPICTIQGFLPLNSSTSNRPSMSLKRLRCRLTRCHIIECKLQNGMTNPALSSTVRAGYRCWVLAKQPGNIFSYVWVWNWILEYETYCHTYEKGTLPYTNFVIVTTTHRHHRRWLVHTPHCWRGYLWPQYC